MKCTCGKQVESLKQMAECITSDLVKHGDNSGAIAWANNYLNRKGSGDADK